MRLSGLIAASVLLLAACGRRDDGPAPAPGNDASVPPAAEASAVPAGTAGAAAAPRWALESSDEGAALALAAPPGRAAIRLACAAEGQRLLVNVAGFRPVASEERLSFGSGGEVVALVADPRGDARRGGVSGSAAVPGNLAALVGGPVSVSYGAQGSGPHPAPPRELARAFVAACHKGAAAIPPPDAPPPPSANPCLVQDGQRLRIAPLRAVGTEPFWGARIEGRCVTYSHPEDQKGTRVWTRFAPSPGGGTWSGALGGRRFELRTREQAGCSDGMSDERYPIAVDLLVGGERRSGCAEPL